MRFDGGWQEKFSRMRWLGATPHTDTVGEEGEKIKERGREISGVEL